MKLSCIPCRTRASELNARFKFRMASFTNGLRISYATASIDGKAEHFLIVTDSSLNHVTEPIHAIV